MDTRIFKIEDFLIVSVPPDLDDRASLSLQQEVLELIEKHSAHGLVIDLTAISVADSFMAKIVGDLSSMARLMGAAAVIVGMQPSIIIAMVDMGIRLNNLNTALNLEKGIELLKKLNKGKAK